MCRTPRAAGASCAPRSTQPQHPKKEGTAERRRSRTPPHAFKKVQLGAGAQPQHSHGQVASGGPSQFFHAVRGVMDIEAPLAAGGLPAWLTQTADPLQLPAVDYEATQQQLDPAAAPEKQAKFAIDSAIATGSVDQLQMILTQIGQHIPQHTLTLMMHALRTAARQGNVGIMQFLLAQIGSCQPQELYLLMKYALDGAGAQDAAQMMDFVLDAVRKAFHASFPQQFFELVQHALNTTAMQGNLGLLKFLMDHTAAAAIPINYDVVFQQAASAGKAESLLKDSINGGAQYESVILMLLQSAANLPENNDSRLGSRQALKTAAKVQLVKSYKQKDPVLFARLMAAIKAYFRGEPALAPDGDMQM